MKTTTSKINQTQFKKIDSLYSKYKESNLKNANLKALYKTKLLTISVFNNDTLMLQGDEKAIFAFNKQVIEGVIADDTRYTHHKKASLTNVDGTIGMDEVGTGDYFGPVITCSCYVPADAVEAITALGVNDSKKIDDKNIKPMAKALKKLVVSEVCVCNPSVYNKIINQFDNANIVKAICHNDALTKLTAKLKNKKYKVILDQFTPRENYVSYLAKAKVKATHVDIIEMRAESKYLAVAAASVIARDAFLDQMKKLSTKVGVTLPRGSVEKVKIINAGKQIIKKAKLADYAKLHFDSITGEILNK